VSVEFQAILAKPNLGGFGALRIQGFLGFARLAGKDCADD
jgi:hypothetical protein